MSLKSKGGDRGPLVIRYKTEIFKRKRPVTYVYLSILYTRVRTEESESLQK